MGIPHKALENSTISGHPVPKDATVLFNLWNIHHDERYWDNPHEFNPFRWIDDSKDYSRGCNESFLPFSAGRRACIGETMAKTELFLIFTRLVRDFRFEPNTEEPMPRLEAECGASLPPDRFSVYFVERKK